MDQLRRLRSSSVAVLACLIAAMLSSDPARSAPAVPPAVAHDAGVWDLSFEKGNRRCRLFLRGEAVDGGFEVAMPAGCHKAFPSIAAVTAWVPGEDGHLVFKDDAEFAIFDFAPVSGMPSLSATAGEDDHYTLTPINPARQAELRASGAETAAAAPSQPAASPVPGAPVAGVLVEKGVGPKLRPQAKAEPGPEPLLPAPTTQEVAGNYAVLRDDRDTGCMVTLEPGARVKAGLPARLAPACRDQGIVIFDPVGWQLDRGSELVLTARKGHTTALTRRDGKTWGNSPPRGAALVLKRL